MPDVTDAILDRMIRTIVEEVDPEQVILFGSRARGDARPDSDVDLLVVESEPFGPDRRRDAAVSQHDDLAKLSSFAVRYRYARFPETAGPIDRPAAIRQVEALMRRVRRLLPAEESTG